MIKPLQCSFPQFWICFNHLDSCGFIIFSSSERQRQPRRLMHCWWWWCRRGHKWPLHMRSLQRGLHKISPKNLPYGLIPKKNEGGGKQHNWGIYINAWAIDFNRKCVRMNNEGPNCLVKQKLWSRHNTLGQHTAMFIDLDVLWLLHFTLLTTLNGSPCWDQLDYCDEVRLLWY